MEKGGPKIEFDGLKRKSEEYLRLMIESATDYAIFTFDTDRLIKSWSKGAETMIGYSEQEIIGQSGDLIFTQEDRDNNAPVNEAQRADKNGRAVNERWHVRKDSSLFWGSGIVSPLRESDGTLVGFVKIMRDRTKTKEAEKRKTFFLKLSETLRLVDRKKIQSEASRLLREHIDATRVIYSEEVEPDQFEVVASDSREGLQDLVGLKYRVSDYSPHTAASTPGGTVTCSNVLIDTGYREMEKQTLAAINIIAWANAPLIKNGKVAGMLTIHFSNPHNWLQDELTLLEETAERTWAAVERIKAEEGLRVSETRFRTLTNALPQVIWTNDPMGSANYFNERWFNYTGLTYDQSFGLGWQQIAHPDDAPRSIEKWHRALAEGKIFETEYRLRNAKGEYRWFIGRNVPLKDDVGNVLGWFGSATDIEALKTAEEALKNTADRLQLALDAGKLGTYEYDFQSHGYTCSAQHKANFGFSETEAVSLEHLIERVVPEDRNSTEISFLEAKDKDAVYAAEFRITKSNGEVRWIRSVGRFVYNKIGEPQKMVGITLDITEEKMFTEELSKQVKEKTLELQLSNEDLRQFAHVASHDLKEPVRKIKTFYNRLNDDYRDHLPEKGQMYLDRIGVAADRMFSMIDGVLHYSKLGNATQSFQRVDLNKILRNIEFDLEVLIQKKNAVITITQLPTLTPNETLMYQLFYNLILNSLKFAKAKEPSRINITCATLQQDQKDVVKITVSDNGIGFEQNYAASIFDPFTRLNTIDEYEGTGLGLALCKKIVERHNGSICATGQPDTGAQFIILLPL